MVAHGRFQGDLDRVIEGDGANPRAELDLLGDGGRAADEQVRGRKRVGSGLAYTSEMLANPGLTEAQAVDQLHLVQVFVIAISSDRVMPLAIGKDAELHLTTSRADSTWPTVWAQRA